MKHQDLNYYKLVVSKGGIGMKKTANSATSAIYGLGFIGAAIYYISIATSFWVGVLGFLKAIVWPVFLVYEALTYLGA